MRSRVSASFFSSASFLRPSLISCSMLVTPGRVFCLVQEVSSQLCKARRGQRLWPSACWNRQAVAHFISAGTRNSSKPCVKSIMVQGLLL